MQMTPMLNIGNAMPGKQPPGSGLAASGLKASGRFQKLLAGLTNQDLPGEATDLLSDNQLLSLLANQGLSGLLPGNLQPDLIAQLPGEVREQLRIQVENFLTAQGSAEALPEELTQATELLHLLGEGKELPTLDEQTALSESVVKGTAKLLTGGDLPPTAGQMQTARSSTSKQPGPENGHPAPTLTVLAADRPAANTYGPVILATSEETSPTATAMKPVPGRGQAEARFDQLLGRLTGPAKSEPSQPLRQRGQTDGSPFPLPLDQSAETVEAIPQPTARPELKLDKTMVKSPMSLETSGLQSPLPWQGHGHMIRHAATQGQVTAQQTISLPTGEQVSEHAVLDQVVGHIRTGHAGKGGEAVLRLHPAELGEVRLDLNLDHDRVRAQLHAQSQQVQAVLERHLPQLKDALEQQGLHVDLLRVEVDSGQAGHDTWQQQFAGQFGQHREPAPHISYNDTVVSGQREVGGPEITPPYRQSQGLSLRI